MVTHGSARKCGEVAEYTHSVQIPVPFKSVDRSDIDSETALHHSLTLYSLASLHFLLLKISLIVETVCQNIFRTFSYPKSEMVEVSKSCQCHNLSRCALRGWKTFSVHI